MWLEGCTHFIIGRDMAGSKSSVTGEDFYGAYDAQETAAKHAEELHMQTVPSLNITYTEVRHMSAHCNMSVQVKGSWLGERAAMQSLI